MCLRKILNRFRPRAKVMKCKIAIVVPHEYEKPGAYANPPLNMSEYDYGSLIADKMASYIQTLDRVNDLFSCEAEIFFRDGVGISGCYSRVKSWIEQYALDHAAIIEPHFNAAPLSVKGRASGTEVLYCDDKDIPGLYEKEFAAIILESLVDVLGTKNRGLKPRPESSGEAGWYNLNQVMEYPSLLPELFFGDHSEDATKGLVRMDQISRSMVDGIVQFFKLRQGKLAGRID